MNNDFEKANLIQNGYFYTFKLNSDKFVVGWDKQPLIYCLGDWEKNINCFVGLNIHKMPISERVKFILDLNNNYPFINKEKSDDEIRCAASINEIDSYFRKYRQCIRYYNRKNILNPYRIKNNCVHYYIEYDGDPMGCDRSKIMSDYYLTENDNVDNQSEESNDKEGK